MYKKNKQFLLEACLILAKLQNIVQLLCNVHAHCFIVYLYQSTAQRIHFPTKKEEGFPA